MSSQSSLTVQSGLEVLRVSLLKQEDELTMLRGTVQRQRTDVVRLLQQRQKSDEATKLVSITFRKLSDDHSAYCENLERDLQLVREELAMEKEKQQQERNLGATNSMLMASTSMRRSVSRKNSIRSQSHRHTSRASVNLESSMQSNTGGGEGGSTSPPPVLPRKRAKSQKPYDDSEGESGGEHVFVTPELLGASGNNNALIDSPRVDDDLVGEILEVESEGAFDEDTDWSDEEEEVVPASYAVELEQKVQELTTANQVQEELLQTLALESEKTHQNDDKWKATEEEANLHRKLIFQEVEQQFSGQLKDTIRTAEENKRHADGKIAELNKEIRGLNQSNGLLLHRAKLSDERLLAMKPTSSSSVRVKSVACSTEMPTTRRSSNTADGTTAATGGHIPHPFAAECWSKDVAVQSDHLEAAVVYVADNNSGVGGEENRDHLGATVGFEQDQQARKYHEVEGLKSFVRELESELEVTRRRLAEESRERTQLEWRVQRRDSQYTESQQDLRALKQELAKSSSATSHLGGGSIDSSVQQLRLTAQLEEAQLALMKLSAENEAATSEVQLGQAEAKNLTVLLSGREAKLASLETQLHDFKAANDELREEKFALAERVELADHHQKSYKGQLLTETEETDRLRRKLASVEKDRDESESRLRTEVMDLASRLRERKETAIATNYKAQRNTVSFLALEAAQDDRDRLRRTLRDTHCVLRNVMEQVGLESALDRSPSSRGGGGDEGVGDGNISVIIADTSTVISGSSPPPKQPSSAGATTNTISASPGSYAPRKSMDPTCTPIDGELLIKDVKSLHLYLTENSNKQQQQQQQQSFQEVKGRSIK